jgi:hypothetical protein
MELVYVTIVLAVLEYMVMGALVGFARTKYNNTLENLIIFIPTVWIFATYFSELWAAILGFLFVVGRAIYAVGYLKAAEKRSIGAGITGIVEMALVVGCLIGLARALV